MAAHQHTSSKENEELEERIEELEHRLSTIESVFSERLLDRERAHTDAKNDNDARKQFEVGEEHRLVVDSPPGQGRDPKKAVGRINGVVTFVDPNGFDVEENDVLRVQIKDRQKSCLYANPLENMR